MNGLFLQGGGAKGAFQAGVIYGLHKKGVKFNVITGTSIGAVNGYFVYTKNFEAMKKYYMESNIESKVFDINVDMVVHNEGIINELKKLSGINEDVKAFYVNYTSVENGKLIQKEVDITKLSKDDALNSVRYSSLLPYVCPNGVKSMSLKEVSQTFNSSEVFDKFSKKLKEGIYDGFNLDGGILNNNYMKPFLTNKVDKIFIVPLHNNFKTPKYLLEKYSPNDLVIIESKTKFKPNDTLRIENKFLRQLFIEGEKIVVEG